MHINHNYPIIDYLFLNSLFLHGMLEHVDRHQFLPPYSSQAVVDGIASDQQVSTMTKNKTRYIGGYWRRNLSLTDLDPSRHTIFPEIK